MTSVPLTRATRDTIFSLRSAIDEAKIAGDRLGSGKRVNSALEDPSTYFTSLALTDRAAELDRTLEQVMQGVQTLRAAYDGLNAITKLMDAAKTMANQASRSLDAFDRADFAKTYNGVLQQMEDIAGDSEYRGKNILLGQGHDLKLYFGDERTDAVLIEAVDYTNISATLGLERVPEGKLGRFESQLMNGTTPLTKDDLLSSAAPAYEVGDVVTVTNGAGKTVSTLTVSPTTKVSDLLKAFNVANDGIRASLGTSGTLTVETTTDMTITVTGTGGTRTTAIDAEEAGWMSPAAPDASLEELKEALEILRLQSVTFGTNLTMLQNRERFMKEFSGTLVAGAEQIIAADKNEEGAKLLALQTRQQLATSALSFAREADQGVLRLLGG
jgi:flagellin